MLFLLQPHSQSTLGPRSWAQVGFSAVGRKHVSQIHIHLQPQKQPYLEVGSLQMLTWAHTGPYIQGQGSSEKRRQRHRAEAEAGVLIPQARAQDWGGHSRSCRS